MAVNLSKIEERLKDKIGDKGVEYLFPQLDIVRQARNLPSKLVDYRLKTQKFYESYQMISNWLAPVIVPISDELIELESQLRELQYQIKFQLQQEGIKFWKDVESSENPNIRSLYQEIVQLRNYILNQRETLMKAAHRAALPELLGLVLWPYTEYANLKEANEEVKSAYFGSNYRYNKNNVLTDALILTAVCEDALQQQKKGKEASKQIEDLIETRLSFQRIEEQFEWSKYKRDPSDGFFSEGQVKTVVKELLPSMSSSKLFQGINTFYDSSKDKYPIGEFIDWLTTATRRRTISGEGGAKIAEAQLTKDHLIGLQIMDKHRRQETLGNISETLQVTFERILAPFHELKQDNAFMNSAQFEIENVMELPSQAWIFDYTGIETEILRSTLLLISDRQPKFDALEVCQRLSNIVLSGRVDRNDIRQGNYTVTNKLPPRIWKYIGDSLLTMLEEALINEESLAVQLIKSIFQEEDRSSLVTSKKFVPVFLVQTDFRRGTDYTSRKQGLQPQTMSIWARDDFIFQYRFAQLSGYPWYFDINELLESLVIEALNLPSHKISQLHENIMLRQTVYTIDDETYIVYYGVEGAILSALAFKETDILSEEGIDPVEVIFRPHKFLRRGPEKNKLSSILENARATDPKDLRTIITRL
jgi:Mg2+ and Co2+ transporter CorA